ncbi:MAG TPA: YihY/virulence factor BrkB family protein [Gaiellaceae bacterium]
MRGFLGDLEHAGKKLLADNMMMFASALAYSTFFTIPSIGLVAIGLFTLVAGPQTIDNLVHSFGHVMPAQATQLLQSSLLRLDHRPGTTIAMTAVGLLLALWSITGAMTGFMTAVNIAYGCKDSRNFLKKRTVALTMAACIAVAFVLLAVLLILGPQVEKRIGPAIGSPTLVAWLWWVLQWPVLASALLATFATVLYLAPNLEVRSWKLVTPGAVVAVVIWLVTSGLFAVYTAKFGSYNKAWGSLSAVIVMLTWLYLSSLALLFGAELNAAIDLRRSRRTDIPLARAA